MEIPTYPDERETEEEAMARLLREHQADRALTEAYLKQRGAQTRAFAAHLEAASKPVVLWEHAGNGFDTRRFRVVRNLVVDAPPATASNAKLIVKPLAAPEAAGALRVRALHSQGSFNSGHPRRFTRDLEFSLAPDAMGAPVWQPIDMASPLVMQTFAQALADALLEVPSLTHVSEIVVATVADDDAAR